MAHFIDRRLNSKGKSTVNRQRFLRRYKKQIKGSVADAIGQRSVTDVDSGESITIPKRDVSEPVFHTGPGGIRDMVHPGNDQFTAGDRIPRPAGGEGGDGSGEGDAADQGEGQDEFSFQISKDEYLDLLFDDLALPNFRKTQYNKVIEYETYRAGYQTDGNPSNLDIVRSLKGSVARRIALTASKKKALKAAQAKLAELVADTLDHPIEIAALKVEIADLEARIKRVPFIDTFDLRFKNYDKRPIPTSKAVMFCLMDVSGSMDQATKDVAKRFYILLYLFLTRNYKDVEVVYIRHHTQAKEVDEQEFFYSQETGGTIVSSALKLMDEIVHERYDSQAWNIYAAQASDGDNWADDSPTCGTLLADKILPYTRYFSYIEITTRSHQSLWREYEVVAQANDNFAMKHIQDAQEIFPIFRELFSKEQAKQMES